MVHAHVYRISQLTDAIHASARNIQKKWNRESAYDVPGPYWGAHVLLHSRLKKTDYKSVQLATQERLPRIVPGIHYPAY